MNGFVKREFIEAMCLDCPRLLIIDLSGKDMLYCRKTRYPLNFLTVDTFDTARSECGEPLQYAQTA